MLQPWSDLLVGELSFPVVIGEIILHGNKGELGATDFGEVRNELRMIFYFLVEKNLGTLSSNLALGRSARARSVEMTSDHTLDIDHDDIAGTVRLKSPSKEAVPIVDPRREAPPFRLSVGRL